MNQLEHQTIGYADDEIDLMELIANIWDGKWLVAGITAISIALGGAYVWLTPNNFTASYPIIPIASTTAAQFDGLNSYAELNEQIPAITAESLERLALEKIRSRLPLLTAAENILSNQDAPGENEKVENLINSLAYGVELLSPEDEDQNWTMQWTSADETESRDFLVSSLANINQSVKQSLREQFMARFEVLETQRENRLEDIDTEIDEAIALNEMRVEQRIAFLQEQAAIARELGIAKNTIEAQTFAATNGFLTNIATDSPFYLRGYEAIEEEINLLSNRTDPTPFVEGLVDLIGERRDIANDRTIDRARAAFNKTPIVSGNFQAIQADANLLAIEQDSRPALIIALATVLGGMIGVFSVLVRKGLRNYRARQQTI